LPVVVLRSLDQPDQEQQDDGPDGGGDQATDQSTGEDRL